MAQQPMGNSGLKPAPLKTDVAVDLIGVHKWYGDFHVLRDINLRVTKSERIVICGPSGSGKSTMIRCINRLEEHQQGRVVVDGTELSGRKAERVLTNDPGTGVLRHVDAGYDEAKRVAAKRGIRIPMAER